MTPDPGPPLTGAPDGQQVSVVVSAERPVVGSAWAVSGRLRLRREIETHTRMIEVTVRREVLSVDYDDAFAPDSAGQIPTPDIVDDPPDDRAPLVIVLREEVPYVVRETVPYETATVRIARVVTEQVVETQLAHERVALDTTPGVPVPTNLGPGS